ncbi:asparagine synthase (glutamine-hydrolyzing) [Sphingomonas sp. RS6]
MGAIAGLYYPAIAKPVDPARIAAMTDAMAHRGPDGSGSWCAPGIGLGHRRLAIAAREDGAQPMVSADRSVAVVHDGRIYNGRELRAELEARGARFDTDCDAEVLIQGWRVWGADLLARLNGMFAFALYDAARQSLFLARDRLGVKPIHYASLADGAFAFASELKGLLAHPMMRRAPDFRAVEDYLGLGYVPDDACIVAGVSKLAAGHFLLIERGRPVPRPTRWWDVDFSRRAAGRSGDLQAELADLMRQAVRLQMQAETPPGALLSAGIGGAAVVALMAEASKAAVQTSAIAVEETAVEAADAVTLAERFAARHQQRSIGAPDPTAIDMLAALFDEPFGDPGALAAWRLRQLARERSAVVLAGDGADDVLAGHRHYLALAAEERIRAVLPEAPRARLFGSIASAWPDAGWMPRPFRARPVLMALAGDGAEAHATRLTVTGADLREALYSKAARAALGGHRAEQRYVETMRMAPAREGLGRAQYVDIRHRLAGAVLTSADRTGMAVGLETRLPLLDHRLVEFAASLPTALRVRRGQGKWLMRRALTPWLPQAMLARREAPAVSLASAWFRTGLVDAAAGLARSPVLIGTGWFDPRTLARIADEHCAGRADHGDTLWQLLVLERSLARLFR